jgi:hypothetical protein
LELILTEFKNSVQKHIALSFTALEILKSGILKDDLSTNHSLAELKARFPGHEDEIDETASKYRKK